MKLLYILLLISCTVVVSGGCLGEYEECPDTHDCVLIHDDCGTCKSGQFLCPDRTTCVSDAESYLSCPGLSGSYFDHTLPVEKRLDLLIEAATIEEKISQLTNDAPDISRLSIPGYNWLNDDEHGVRGGHATMFPSGCCLGAGWSKKTLFDIGVAVGEEARGIHNTLVHSGNRGHGMNGAGITLYAPNINLVTRPNWGRAQEVYSEDPLLSSKLTYGYVTGLQRGEHEGNYLLTAACCKHYAGYDLESIPESRFTFNANITARNMWETFMPAFQSCLLDANGAHVMCSYNSINGIPTCADPELMNGLLRKKWRREVFVVSDYDAWANLKDTHKYCDSYEDAAVVGLLAGLDQEGGGTVVIDTLQKALEDGKVTEDDISTAFKRLFRVRIDLGMLDPPSLVKWNKVNSSVVLSEEHIALARRSAQEGACLYKNERNTLPLDPMKKIAIIGPHAVGTDILLGNYADPPDTGIASILRGVYESLGVPIPSNCSSYEKDVDYYQPGQDGVSCSDVDHCCEMCSMDINCNFFTFYNGRCYKKKTDEGKTSSPGRVSSQCTGHESSRIVYAPGCSSVECPDTSLFPQAVEAVKGVDAVVVTLGLDQSIESEGRDKSDLNLPLNQYSLFSAIRRSTSAPLIAVLIHGGTLSLRNITNEADGILDMWYPGMEGGRATSDVLFGVCNPAGRASVTYYEDISQLPPPGTMDLYEGMTYRYFEGKPVYPFGYGMSYTSFSYSGLRFGHSSIDACDSLDVYVSVKNDGLVDGDEVVQVYVRQPMSTVPVPNIRLAAFERVYIKSGEVEDVHLVITPEYHSVVYDTSSIYDGKVGVEKGTLSVYVGGGQPDYYPGHLSGSVEVLDSKLLDSC